MNKIEAFKTTDGKIFEDEAEAEAHDTRLAAMRAVGRLLVAHDFPITLDSFSASDVVEYMVNNADKFVDALSGIEIAEDTGEESVDLDDEVEGDVFIVPGPAPEGVVEEEFDSLGRGNGSDGSEAPAAQPDDDIPF